MGRSEDQEGVDSLLVRVHLSLSTVSEPLELPLRPSDFLGLDVVPRELLLLGRLELEFRLVAAAGGGGVGRGGLGAGSGTNSRRDGRGGGRGSGSGGGGAVLESVLDETNLSDVGEASSVDVPDLGEGKEGRTG